MKTSELIKEILKLDGFSITKEFGKIIVNLAGNPNSLVAIVDVEILGCLDTRYIYFQELQEPKKLDLLNILVEYAMTPLDEREEQPKYTAQLVLKGNHEIYQRENYLAFDTDKKGVYLTKKSLSSGFTCEELKGLGVWNNSLFKIKKKVVEY